MTTPTTFKAALTSFNSNDTETDTDSSSGDSHKRKRITEAEAALECVKEARLTNATVVAEMIVSRNALVSAERLRDAAIAAHANGSTQFKIRIYNFDEIKAKYEATVKRAVVAYKALADAVLNVHHTKAAAADAVIFSAVKPS